MNKKITLNFTMYTLVVGQVDKYTFSGWKEEGGNIQLIATLADTEYKNEDVLWTSDNPEVAQVTLGKVRALTTGVTDIKATLPDGSYAECRVQVIDNIGRLTVQHVSFNTNRLILNKTEGAVLYPNILPVDYFDNGYLDTTFSWSSTDTDIAIVDHRGRVYAKECGKVVITAVSNDIGKTASCEIEVIEKSKEELYVDPLEDVDCGVVVLNIDENQKLVLPTEVNNQPVFWSSGNAGIVHVDEEGNIRAYREGSADIWATFINGGYRVHYQIRVAALPEHPVTEIHLNRYHLNLAAGEQTNLYAAVFPATLLEKQLTWNVSDENVVRIVKQHINLSGLDEVILEGVGEGTAVVSGSLEGKEVSCSVSISEKSVYIREIILQEELNLELEEVKELKPKINNDATSMEVIWISKNRSLATVDKDGVLKAYNTGEGALYCIAADNLTKQDIATLQELKEYDNIEGDKEALQRLENILTKAVHGKCRLSIDAEHMALYNLHIPEETIMSDRVCLLWNRKAWIDIENFKEYRIYRNEECIATVDTLGYTVKNLKPQTEYTFVVAAVSLDDKEIYKKEIRAITKPTEKMVLDVTKAPYGAIGDGIATDTHAIQRAIDDCPKDGVVCLPKGYVFMSGALFLRSNMTFQVEGILLGSIDARDYPPIVCRWEGYRKMKLTKENQDNTVPVFDDNVYSHSSLINAGVYDEGSAGKLSPYHTENLNICGNGMINGNGFSLSYNQGPCWYTHRKGLPIPHSPKRDQNIRGRVIAIYNAEHVCISDVTVTYGPAWTMHPVFCNHVTFDNVKVISMGDGRTGTTEGMLSLNGDGIDPDSCTNINIVNCYFTVGDDAVAIKSGRNRQGNELAKPSAYIRVTDCTCVDAKGAFCIGSEQAGGVHDVLFQNLKVENLKNFGLWIKSAPCRGGLVEDILWRDCLLKDTGGALQIEYNHGGDENPSLVLPETRRITYENIEFVGKNKFGIRIMGVPDSLIHDVEFRGCRFKDFEAKEREFVLSDCKNIRFVDTQLPEGYKWIQE